MLHKACGDQYRYMICRSLPRTQFFESICNPSQELVLHEACLVWWVVCYSGASSSAHSYDLQIAFPSSKDRKSTRLNSSHLGISYAVFCLKKKKKNNNSMLDAIKLNQAAHTDR